MSVVSEVQKKPVISVIIPAYNMEMYIEQAIRSVMNQTFQDWELFVMDDCSSDSTVSIAERLAAEDDRIILVRNSQNMGVARTRNSAFDLCRGEYIAFLDSDDIWHPEKLEKQLEVIRQTDTDICYTSYSIIDAAGKKVKPDYIVPKTTTFASLLRENTIGCSTVLLSAAMVEKYRFEIDFYHEDYVLWVSILRNGGKAVGCREILTQWRYIADSRSFDKRRAAQNRWRIYRKYLKLPLGTCVCAFFGYAIAGVKKYYRKPNE